MSGFRVPMDIGPSTAQRLYVHGVVIAGLVCAWLTLSAVILEAITPRQPNQAATAPNEPRAAFGLPCEQPGRPEPTRAAMRATCAPVLRGPSVVGRRGYPHGGDAPAPAGPNSGGRAPGASAGLFEAR